MAVRARIRTIVEHRRFQNFIIVVILANAATLGLETSTGFSADTHELLHAADRVAMFVFTAELALRIYGHGWKFFKDPWNVFDFVVITIALIPATGPFTILRALRVLRVLRLMAAVPAMKRVVNGLLAAIPGLVSIAALLALILYVAAVMATQMFRHAAPEYFDDMGTSLFTLFQTMTGEAWPDVARTVMHEEPVAWLFFVVYIVVSTFAVLNLFIAVIVSGLEHQHAEEAALENSQAAHPTPNQQLVEEVRSLRTEIAALRAEIVANAVPGAP
ncbi:MAG: ion transporter [Mycobacteriaceae bacterium]|nr:ion transporter [Mycobacteriaceae bacterium]